MMVCVDRLKVFDSRDVELDCELHVQALHGQLPHSQTGTVENEVFVSARLIANEEPLTN